MLVPRKPGTTATATPPATHASPAPQAAVPPRPPAPPVHAPAPPPPVAATPPPPIPAPRPAPVAPPRTVAAPQPPPPVPARSLVPVVAPSLPAFIEPAADGDVPVGFENMGSEAYQLSMLSIAQANSPQVQSETPTLRAGDAYLTTNRDVALFSPGDQVPVLPFFYYKCWDQWNHRDLGGGLIESSVDPMGPIAKMAAQQMKRRAGTKPTAAEQPVQAVESLVFLVLIKDMDETTQEISYKPVAIPFTKSKYKKGRLWLQLAQKASQGKYPLYSSEYLIRTFLEKGKQGSYFNFDVDFSPDALTQADYEAAKKAYVEFKAIFEQRQLKVRMEDDTVAEAEVIGPVPGDEAKAY